MDSIQSSRYVYMYASTYVERSLSAMNLNNSIDVNLCSFPVIQKSFQFIRNFENIILLAYYKIYRDIYVTVL